MGKQWRLKTFKKINEMTRDQLLGTFTKIPDSTLILNI